MTATTTYRCDRCGKVVEEYYEVFCTVFKRDGSLTISKECHRHYCKNCLLKAHPWIDDF